MSEKRDAREDENRVRRATIWILIGRLKMSLSQTGH